MITLPCTYTFNKGELPLPCSVPVIVASHCNMLRCTTAPKGRHLLFLALPMLLPLQWQGVKAYHGIEMCCQRP
jgi:hypothetical protein